MSEKRKIKRFNLDEGHIWEAIEGLSPFKTTYSLEEVCEKLNELYDENKELRKELDNLKSSSAENQKVVQSNDDDFIKEVGGKLFFKI